MSSSHYSGVRASIFSDADVSATLASLGVGAPETSDEVLDRARRMRALAHLSQHAGGPIQFELLECAEEALQEIDRMGFRKRLIRDLWCEISMARAWALIGEGHEADAAEVLAVGSRDMERGTGDPLLLAHFHEATAWIASASGEVKIAIKHLGNAVDLYESIGQTPDLVSARIRRESLSRLHGWPQLDGHQDLRLALDLLGCTRGHDEILRALEFGERAGGALEGWVFGLSMDLAAAALPLGLAKRIQGESWALAALTLDSGGEECAPELLEHARHRLLFDLSPSRRRVEEIALGRPRDLSWAMATLDAWSELQTPLPNSWSAPNPDERGIPRELVFSAFERPSA